MPRGGGFQEGFAVCRDDFRNVAAAGGPPPRRPAAARSARARRFFGFPTALASARFAVGYIVDAPKLPFVGRQKRILLVAFWRKKGDVRREDVSSLAGLDRTCRAEDRGATFQSYELECAALKTAALRSNLADLGCGTPATRYRFASSETAGI